MESRSLVPQSSPFLLPVAKMRRVFHPDEVERKLAKLPDNEHDSLRATFPAHAGARPSALSGQTVGRARYGQPVPNPAQFHRRTGQCQASRGLAQDTHDGLEVTPILLLRFTPASARPTSLKSWPNCWEPA